MDKALFTEKNRPYLWIALAVLVVYGQVLFFKYTYLDDYTLIVQHAESFTTAKNLFRSFTTDFLEPVSGGEYYRPLLSASLILNGIIAGQSPFLFHLTDVLIHLGVCLLLYRFLLNLTGSKYTALLGSLIFAVHPILVQTVAWIPARNDSLATLFILWYLIAFDQVLKSPAVKKHYWYAAMAMALALFSKESAIIIPFISLLYAWFIAENKSKYKTLWRFVPIWIGLLVLWLAGRGAALTQAEAINLKILFSSVYYSLAAVVQYLGKMMFPFDLSTYPVMADLRLTYGLIALVVIALAILVSKHKRYRLVYFGVAWFLAFVLLSLVRTKPVSLSEYISGRAGIMEHRAYLPLIGLLIIVLEFDWFKKEWWKSRLKLVTASVVIAVFAVINIVYASHFRNGIKYWEHAIKTSPSSPYSYRQLGSMRQLAGDKSGAEAAYKKAIAINSEGTLAYNNLGLLYTDMARYREAEMMFRWEIVTNVTSDKAYMNLGNLYWKTNRWDEAEKMWQKTIELNPSFFQAYRNLAIYYYEKDQYDKGVAILNDIVSQGGKID